MSRAKCRRCGKREPVRPSVYCAKNEYCNKLREEEMGNKKREAEGDPRTRAGKRQRGVVVPELGIGGNQYPAKALSGIVRRVPVGVGALPEWIPSMSTGDTGVRVVFANKNVKNGEVVRGVVKQKILAWEGVKRAVHGKASFVSAAADGRQKARGGALSEVGVIHQDPSLRKMARVTVSIPMETYNSGGIEIWRGSEEFLPERTRAVESGETRIRNLKQQLDAKFTSETWSVKKGQALIFDSRLWHRSLVHRDEGERHAFTYFVGLNGAPKLDFNEDMPTPKKPVGWVKRS